MASTMLETFSLCGLINPFLCKILSCIKYFQSRWRNGLWALLHTHTHPLTLTLENVENVVAHPEWLNLTAVTSHHSLWKRGLWEPEEPWHAHTFPSTHHPVVWRKTAAGPRPPCWNTEHTSECNPAHTTFTSRKKSPKLQGSWCWFLVDQGHQMQLQCRKEWGEVLMGKRVFFRRPLDKVPPCDHECHSSWVARCLRVGSAGFSPEWMQRHLPS